MTDRDYTALDAAIANLNLIYNASFVPQNESRNKAAKEPSLNWTITLNKTGKTGAVRGLELVTDYMQGIGYVPGYPQGLAGRRRTIEEDEQLKFYTSAAWTGKYPTKFHRNINHTSTKPLPPPTLRDVLYSLVADSDVLETSGFEEWASNLGYDTDSRKAEAIYNSCIEIALKLKALIGWENLEKLRELFQDY